MTPLTHKGHKHRAMYWTVKDRLEKAYEEIKSLRVENVELKKELKVLRNPTATHNGRSIFD